MPKYRVRVEMTSYETVEVKSETPQGAIKEAMHQAQRSCYGKTSKSGEILSTGPEDEPLVKCPTEWEIYSSMSGATKANAAITEAALQVTARMLKAHKDGHDIGPKIVSTFVKDHLKPVFKKYNKFGTGDSEPRANMADYLSRYAKGLGVGREMSEAIYEEIRWNL